MEERGNSPGPSDPAESSGSFEDFQFLFQRPAPHTGAGAAEWALVHFARLTQRGTDLPGEPDARTS